jgi:hypothetical protein
MNDAAKETFPPATSGARPRVFSPRALVFEQAPFIGSTSTVCGRVVRHHEFLPFHRRKFALAREMARLPAHNLFRELNWRTTARTLTSSSFMRSPQSLSVFGEG